MAIGEIIHTEELVFEVDGSRIAADKFRKGFNAFLDVIDEVVRDISGKTRSINWIISLSQGSMRIHLRPEPRSRRMSPQKVSFILDTIQAGFGTIESGSGRPEHFSDGALRKIRELASIVDSKDSGLDAVKIRRNGQTNNVTTQTQANVDSFLGTASKDWGSIEGKLCIVSARGGYTFSVYDDVDNRYVPCNFPDELLPKVLTAFGKRVSVSGIIRYTGHGEIRSVAVEDFEAFPASRELPGFEDVYGLLGGHENNHLDS